MEEESTQSGAGVRSTVCMAPVLLSSYLVRGDPDPRAPPRPPAVRPRPLARPGAAAAVPPPVLGGRRPALQLPGPLVPVAGRAAPLVPPQNLAPAVLAHTWVGRRKENEQSTHSRTLVHVNTCARRTHVQYVRMCTRNLSASPSPVSCPCGPVCPGRSFTCTLV